MADARPNITLINELLERCRFKTQALGGVHPRPVMELLECVQLLRMAVQELVPREEPKDRYEDGYR